MADVTEGQNCQLQMQKLTAENSELKGLYNSLVFSWLTGHVEQFASKYPVKSPKYFTVIWIIRSGSVAG